MWLSSSNSKLPCNQRHNGCKTAGHTFSWSPEHNFCALSYILWSTGVVVSSKHGEEVFISNDGSNIRLLLKASTNHCGKTTRITHLPNILVYVLPTSSSADLGATYASTAFHRQSRPSDSIIFSEVKLQDKSVPVFLDQHLQEEVQHVRRRDCEIRSRNFDHKPQPLHLSTRTTTIPLGGNHFATTTGIRSSYYIELFNNNFFLCS